MRSILRSLLPSRLAHPKRACFTLYYESPEGRTLTVGRLLFEGGVWRFNYDSEFKAAKLRPIEGMEDLEKVYESPILFPFFAVRIPDVARADVRRRLAEKHVSDPETADLLRLFGGRVVSSPAFELRPA